MAMSVNCDLNLATLEVERGRFALKQITEVFLKEKTTSSDSLRVRQIQFPIVLDEHRVTGRLEKKNRGGISGAMEKLEIVLS